jgi:hypothetical protein
MVGFGICRLPTDTYIVFVVSFLIHFAIHSNVKSLDIQCFTSASESASYAWMTCGTCYSVSRDELCNVTPL